jgi:hypothetical protein
VNGQEQRKRRIVTATIANNLESVANATAQRLAAIERRAMDTEKLLRTQISEERTHRLKLADEQRAYVDRADTQHEAALRDLTQRTAFAVEIAGRKFWGRMRFAFFGT